MAPLRPSPALQQYVDDELLRAPMIFERALGGIAEQTRRELALRNPFQRRVVAEMLQAVQVHRARLTDRYVEALRDQVRLELARQPAPSGAAKAPRAEMLALVEEDAVALDIELSQTIQLIRSIAEQELRELRTYVAALVGDLDVSADHNPFRPESHAKALWTAAQAVPISRSWQMHFMRQATAPLASILRQSYAAASTRLESMGVEPASHRTVISTTGSRRSAGVETTYTPDLYRMRDTMAAPLDGGGPLRYDGQLSGTGVPKRENWIDIARQANSQTDRQSVELVGRLFDAIVTDERVPPDVILLISRLHGPAMRLTLRDTGVLDQKSHPLWRFIHLVTYEAEMAPDRADPERRRLLRLAQQLIDQIAADPDQRPAIYRRAVQAVEDFLRQRLQRRLTSSATQVGALQKLEHQVLDGAGGPDTVGGVVDLPVMDTVPADLLVETAANPPPGGTAAGTWLASLEVGTWVRLFLSGRWVHAQLLWIGDRGEIWLFGDGASDATWAVRRGALLRLQDAALAKTLTMRSLLGRAALKVQQQVAVQGQR